MQYKRWRVVAARGLVNASAVALLIFLASCGRPTPESPSPEGQASPSEAPSGAPSTSPDAASLSLPAVWSTRALDGPVADIALSSGPRPLLAVAFQGRGFQLFDLGGDRLGEPIGFGLTDLASGHYAEIDGAAVNVFPGINRDGALKAYLYGENLTAPVELDLPVEPGGAVAGLCSGPPRQQADSGLMDIGFWVEDADRTLVTGTVGIDGETFTWSAGATIAAASPLAGCRIGSGGQDPLPVVGTPLATAEMHRPDGHYALTLDADGKMLAARPGGATHAIALRKGLSVRLPDPAVAMDALGTPSDGGYPYGLIVIAGETRPGMHQAVFVDTEPLVRPAEEAAGIPAAE